MKTTRIKDLNHWEGRRESAGRLRMTAPLTSELEAALQTQASATGRTPEAHAAHLIDQDLSAPVVLPQLIRLSRSAKVRARPVLPVPPPLTLRQFVPGVVAPGSILHRELIDDLDDRANLKEQARDVWQLISTSGEVRRVSSNTMSMLMFKGVLEEQS